MERSCKEAFVLVSPVCKNRDFPCCYKHECQWNVKAKTLFHNLSNKILNYNNVLKTVINFATEKLVEATGTYEAQLARGSKRDRDSTTEKRDVERDSDLVKQPPSSGSAELASVACRLETKELWDKFHELGTEMIITKSGRYVAFFY